MGESVIRDRVIDETKRIPENKLPELEVYDWGFDSAQPDEGIDLRHNFYEVDYLPEDDSK